MKRFLSILASLALLVILASDGMAQRSVGVRPRQPANTGQRVALVIGNFSYTRIATLGNPGNDARDMAAALESSGFKVTLLLDANRKKMNQAIRDLGRSLQKGGVGLFYYAGHGVQVEGTNYLIPIGADINQEFEVQDEAVSTNRILGMMKSAGNSLNMVFLDACRNNPYKGSFRSATRGLAAVSRTPKGSLISYATDAGAVAADGTGRNGTYTKHLLRYMREPGLELSQMMKRVRAGVERDTGGKQTPFELSSLTGDFYFTRARMDTSRPATFAKTQPRAEDPKDDPAATDAWEMVKRSDDIFILKDFLRQFPGSRYAKTARFRIGILERQKSGQQARLDEERRRRDAEERRLARERRRQERLEAERSRREAEARGLAERRRRREGPPPTYNLGRVRWKVQSSFGSKLPILGVSGFEFSRRLKRMSNGAINLKFFEPGALNPSLESFNTVRNGGIEAAYTSSAYNTGHNMAFSIFASIPFGMSADLFYEWITTGPGRSLYENLYSRYGIVPIPCTMYGPEGFGWFKRQIHTPGDLRGIKMRFFGLGAKVMQKLGVSTQLLAATDIYPALERGVIDATEFSFPHIDIALGFYQITKNYYYPGWHQRSSMVDLQINKRTWERLRPNARNLIRYACKENMKSSLREERRLSLQAVSTTWLH